MSGVELTRIISKQFPEIKILALSMFGDTNVVTEMIDAGISGFILKNTGRQELMEALDKIATFIVPHFADWFVINQLRDDGYAYLVKMAHRFPWEFHFISCHKSLAIGSE